VIFDLDNVLVKSQYKKDKTREYDACVYMSILNSKKIKVWSNLKLTSIARGDFPAFCEGHVRSIKERF
jgi:hypothetical protein